MQIDRDFADPASVDQYVVTPFIEGVHARLAASLRPLSTQRAWRLTGDYGAGKSSFGLAFAKHAAGLGDELPASLRPEAGAPKLAPVLVLGEREPLAKGVLRAIEQTLRRTGLAPSRRLKSRLSRAEGDRGGTAVLAALEAFGDQLREDHQADGVLIIFDELGKNLEYAALTPAGDDIHLLQRIADAAQRSGPAPLVVLAVLHQGVDAYAEDLSSLRRKDWAKVASRFEELLFAPPIEQSAVLVATALEALGEPPSPALKADAARTMEHGVAEGWYGAGAHRQELVDLAPRLAPLDPMVLPVLSRVLRRFGQNERSLFSFLSSEEPHGLLDHRRVTGGTRAYRLHDLFDYLSVNLSSALQSRAAGTRWGVIDGVLRSAPASGPFELQALKTVGVINLLDDHGFSLTRDLLVWALAGSDPDARREAEKAVSRVSEELRLVYDRGAGGGLCLWPHTSVDIEAAFEAGLKASPLDAGLIAGLSEILPTEPVVARRHYVETGALRHFDLRYSEARDLAEALGADVAFGRRDGQVVLALSQTEAQRDAILALIAAHRDWKDTVLVGAPEPVGGLAPLLRDVKAWRWVATNTPGLAGDRIARDEVGRQSALAEDRLRRSVTALIDLRGDGALTTRWFYKGDPVDIRSGRDLASRLSDICDTAFKWSPVVRNELINRRQLSSAAARARSLLIEHLSAHADKKLLGLDPTHMPPEMAIYRSLIEKGGVHALRGERWSIGLPEKDVLRLAPTLERIGVLLRAQEDRHVPYLELAEALREPPYGVRDGVFPLMLAVYLAIHWHHTAVYEDGTYLERVGAPEFARMLKESEHFSIQHCAVEGVRAEVFTRLAAVAGVPPTEVNLDLLDVVRPLLTFVAGLPDHARRTRSVSVMTAAVRTVLLRVHDPNALLFTDLPVACGLEPFGAAEPLDETRLDDFVQAMEDAVRELRLAYPHLIERITAALRSTFGVSGDLASVQQALAKRAEPLMDWVVEPDLKALVLRLADRKLQPTAWLESLASNMGRKPPERWGEVEEREFLHRLKLLGRRFGRVSTAAAAAEGRLSSVVDKGAYHVLITSADGQEFDDVVHGALNGPEMPELEAQFRLLLETHGASGVLAAARAIVAHQNPDPQNEVVP